MTACFHRLGFVDGQITTVVILAVQGVNGLLAFFGAAHGDKTEAAGAVGFTIHDEVGFGDRAVFGKKGVEVLFGGLEGKISYVQFHAILFSVFKVATSRRLLKSVQDALGYRWERTGDNLRHYYLASEGSDGSIKEKGRTDPGRVKV